MPQIVSHDVTDANQGDLDDMYDNPVIHNKSSNDEQKKSKKANVSVEEIKQVPEERKQEPNSNAPDGWQISQWNTDLNKEQPMTKNPQEVQVQPSVL